MTIDERLEFLLQSTESLHANVQEMSTNVQELSRATHEQGERMAELDRRERKGRQAILAAIQAYLSTLNNGDGNDNE